MSPNMKRINPAPSCGVLDPTGRISSYHSSPQQAAGYSGRCGIKIKIILFAVFFLASAWVFSDYSSAQEQEAASAGTRDADFKKSMSYSAGKLRDPFKTPLKVETVIPEIVVSNVSPPSLKIQGVFWDCDSARAIINNKIVKAGDIIEGAKIVSIEKDNITIFFVNRQFLFPAPAFENSKVYSHKGQKEDIHANQF